MLKYENQLPGPCLTVTRLYCSHSDVCSHPGPNLIDIQSPVLIHNLKNYNRRLILCESLKTDLAFRNPTCFSASVPGSGSERLPCKPETPAALQSSVVIEYSIDSRRE